MSNIQENTNTTEPSALIGTPVKARLKWFNAPKGFGFVNPEDREDVDAFLHITTLQSAGVQTIGEGACLLCEIEYGDKGANVKQIIEVTNNGKIESGISHDGPLSEGDESGVQKMEGTVKWYKPEEGFGFITPDDGLKDVFIHKTCLERHDIDALEAGQRIFMTFRNVPKGREVVSLKIINENS